MSSRMKISSKKVKSIPQNHPKDYIKEDLDILFLGTSPRQLKNHEHHFSSVKNHFWPCIHESGLIPQELTYKEDHHLLEYGIGLMDISPRRFKLTPKNCSQKISEFLYKKLKKYRPKIVVFTSKNIFEAVTGKLEYNMGKQPNDIEFLCDLNVYVYLMPNPAKSSFLPDPDYVVHYFVGLKILRDYLNGKLTKIDDEDVVFTDYIQFETKPQESSKGKKLERMWKIQSLTTLLVDVNGNHFDESEVKALVNNQLLDSYNDVIDLAEHLSQTYGTFIDESNSRKRYRSDSDSEPEFNFTEESDPAKKRKVSYEPICSQPVVMPMEQPYNVVTPGFIDPHNMVPSSNGVQSLISQCQMNNLTYGQETPPLRYINLEDHCVTHMPYPNLDGSIQYLPFLMKKYSIVEFTALDQHDHSYLDQQKGNIATHLHEQPVQIQINQTEKQSNEEGEAEEKSATQQSDAHSVLEKTNDQSVQEKNGDKTADNLESTQNNEKVVAQEETSN